VDPAMRGLVDGGMLGWTPLAGWRRECGPPRPRWAGGAVDPAMRGLVDGGMLGTAAGAAVFRWGCRQDSWYRVP